ncbi:MAG: Fur family transcriptional regulator, peroxide stress response regulator [Pyrinomonadaceae bacterium]|jgi:Fe2+ or Zn2+ uptake regulation protein|nr:Fur family transcriptional regulator, peroxide stress response regulator [Pyrinomonadaceae bacterium]
MTSDKKDRGRDDGDGSGGLTPQRRAVLRVVRESDGHLTAAEIFAAAQKLLPKISYATVYNSLRYLKEAGLLGEITFGNAASRYDRETARHDHAVCTACGKLLDFDLAETLGLMKLAARRSRFKPASIHLTLVGLCPDCSGQPAASRSGGGGRRKR